MNLSKDRIVESPQTLVGVYRQASAQYSQRPPFGPPKVFPEYPLQLSELDPTNETYESVRNLLRLLGLDAANFGRKQWNPLGDIIHPSDKVLLKPNLIRESHLYNDGWECVITHGSIVRAMLDYVYIALQGQGAILVADGPQMDSDFAKICERTGLAEIVRIYPQGEEFAVSLADLSDTRWIEKDGVLVQKIQLPGDPAGYTTVNLGALSMFASVQKPRKYYGAFYDIEETNAHHQNGTHEYCFSRSALDCDVFINLPKLKTHKKVGVTLNLKNVVGLTGKRNWLPHYALGAPVDGGDQFPQRSLRSRLENVLVKRAKGMLVRQNTVAQFFARHLKRTAYATFGQPEEVVRSGNWYGNDTAWRMVLDLNRILMFSANDGTLVPGTRRRFFSVIDGIVGGEGNGPMAPQPRTAGILVAAFNPVAADVVASRLMGFDYRKIPQLAHAFDEDAFSLAKFRAEAIKVVSNDPTLNGDRLLASAEPFLQFEPPFGWKGHIEVDSREMH
jgi:uncharacterized protein (DUF362 family)